MAHVELFINDLAERMVLAKDITSGTGLLLLSKGLTIAAKNIQALKRYNQLDPYRGAYMSRPRGRQ